MCPGWEEHYLVADCKYSRGEDVADDNDSKNETNDVEKMYEEVSYDGTVYEERWYIG